MLLNREQKFIVRQITNIGTQRKITAIKYRH